jgi:hypothetical protein
MNVKPKKLILKNSFWTELFPKKITNGNNINAETKKKTLLNDKKFLALEMK